MYLTWQPCDTSKGQFFKYIFVILALSIILCVETGSNNIVYGDGRQVSSTWYLNSLLYYAPYVPYPFPWWHVIDRSFFFLHKVSKPKVKSQRTQLPGWGRTQLSLWLPGMIMPAGEGKHILFTQTICQPLGKHGPLSLSLSSTSYLCLPL